MVYEAEAELVKLLGLRGVGVVLYRIEVNTKGNIPDASVTLMKRTWSPRGIVPPGISNNGDPIVEFIGRHSMDGFVTVM